MTIKKRLFWSNIFMILVPVIAAALVGLLCVGFIWFALIHGMGIGIHDDGEFEAACAAISEGVRESLENGSDLSSIQAILEKNGLTLKVDAGGRRSILAAGRSPATAPCMRRRICWGMRLRSRRTAVYSMPIRSRPAVEPTRST